MAVAFDALSQSHTTTTFSTAQSSFNWTHTPAGTPRGAMVFVVCGNGAVSPATTVTYGGTNVPAAAGGEAADTATEPLNVKAYVLGSSVPTGAQTVVVNRTNNAGNVHAFCITVTASGDVEVHGIVLEQEDQALTEENVTDGSPGTNSLRIACVASGTAAESNLAVGSNSTAGTYVDFGNMVAKIVRETTPGQGSRPVGVSFVTSDDVAAVYLAIREVAAGGAPKKKIMNVYRQYRS